MASILTHLTSFQYLILVLMGYSLVTATMLISFGRLSDMYGKVKLYNIGLLIFTPGSILFFLTPGKRDAGAIELIVIRLIQAVSMMVKIEGYTRKNVSLLFVEVDYLNRNF